MKSSSDKNKHIKDVLLFFQPISISFNKPDLKTYKVYLQKDAQVIGQIKQYIVIRPYQNNYTFKSQNNSIPFRVVNIKNSVYQITIYEVCAKDEEIIYDQSELSLTKFLIDYERDYNLIHDEIQKNCNKKQVDSTLNHWNGLSLNFTRKDLSSGVKFEKTGTVLQFIVKTQNDYDDLAKKDKLMKQKRQEQRKMRKSNTLKAATLPVCTLIKNRNSSKETPSAPNLNILSFDPKISYDHYHKQQPISKQQLKAIQIKIPIHSNPKEEQKQTKQYISQISYMPQNSKHYNLNENEDQFNNLNQIHETNQQYLQNQQQNQVDPNDIQFQGDMEKQIQIALNKNFNIQKIYNQEQIKEMYQQRNREGASPQIYLQNYSDLKDTFRKSIQPTKLGSLNIQSNIDSVQQLQQKSSLKIKEICITFIAICLYSVIIFWLMHPINKI